MRRDIASLMILAAGIICGAAAPLPGAETAVQRAERRGVAMFWYDRAAWVSTDDLMEKLPASRLEDIAGWIVSPSPIGLKVDYIGKAAPDRVIYSVVVNGRTVSNRRIYPAGGEARLDQTSVQMATAWVAARAEMTRHPDWRPCASAPFNTIVLPAEKDGIMPVYFLTPQTESGTYPFGGHYEVDVAADGHVAATRAFSRTCLTMTNKNAPSGSKPAGLILSHFLDPQPTEIHVFQQLGIGVPLYVAIVEPQLNWKVESGLISEVADPAR